MSVRFRDLLMRELGELRYEPTQKRIRATLGDQVVIDSTSALLVWEPQRVVPTYAVPVADIVGEITAADAPTLDQAEIRTPELDGRPVLDPSIPFDVHTADGEPVTVRTADGGRASAFRPFDAELAGYVALDFDAFDAWYEEDELNVAHPRDPFHGIDIVHSSRHVRVERDGQLLAESSRPYLLFEPPLPVRYYLPPEDVRMDALQRSGRTSFCAYKGQASYWALDGEDVAWGYEAPLREAAELQGRLAFLGEHLDITVDGEPLERPVTPFSRR